MYLKTEKKQASLWLRALSRSWQLQTHDYPKPSACYHHIKGQDSLIWIWWIQAFSLQQGVSSGLVSSCLLLRSSWCQGSFSITHSGHFQHICKYCSSNASDVFLPLLRNLACAYVKSHCLSVNNPLPFDELKQLCSRYTFSDMTFSRSWCSGCNWADWRCLRLQTLSECSFSAGQLTIKDWSPTACVQILVLPFISSRLSLRPLST